MKIFINKILILLTITVLVGACEDPDLTVLNPNATSAVTLSESEVTLKQVDMGKDALTVTWSEPDFGFSAAANYEVLFDLAGGDFSSAIAENKGIIDNEDGTYSLTLKTEELNSILLNLGVEFDQPTDIIVMARAILSSSTNVGSEVQPLLATAFEEKLIPLYMIGAALKGWDPNLAVEVYGLAPNEFQVIAEFHNEGDANFRFFAEPDWGADSYNWTYFEGGEVDDKLINAEDGDSNFKFIGDSGFYSIYVNLTTKNIVMTAVDAPEQYLVGAGVPEAGWSWDHPVVMTWVQDGIFEVETEFSNDTFRIFYKAGWGTGHNYPYYVEEGFEIDPNFEDALDGDNNFRFIGTPGVYTFRVDYNKKKITLSN